MSVTAPAPLPLIHSGRREGSASKELRFGRNYPFTTTIESPRAQQLAGGGSSELALPMADFECEHGRLPTDSTPDCGCWSEGQRKAFAKAKSIRPENKKPAAAITDREAEALKPPIAIVTEAPGDEPAATVLGPYPPIAPETYDDDVLGSVLRDLDAEINRLLEARERLHELRRTDA